MRRSWLVFPLFAVLPAATALAGSVHLKRTPESVLITVHGRPFSEYEIGAQTAKPFLAPLRTLSGIVVTRRWPMETVEGESHDHQHHRGLWIGYGNISGTNFWENEFTYKPHNRGTITLTSLDELRESTSTGYIKATFLWHDPEHQTMLTEHRSLAITEYPDRIGIDIDTELTAALPVTFEDTKEGFFAIRVADAIAGQNGGTLSNAEGGEGEKAVWGKRSAWALYSGTIQDKRVQIAIFDHPANPNHAPRWHARAYGLFAANPFGVKDFEPASAVKGGMALQKGQVLRFRYRVLLHEGEVSHDQIDAWYRDYSR